MEQDYPLELPLASRSARPRISDLLAGETFLRLHPHWFVEDYEQAEGRVATRLRDYATDDEFRLVYRVSADTDGLPTLVFSEGPLSEMRFHRQDDMLHVRVTSDQDIARLDENFGLTLWLRGIREYIRLYLSRSLNTLFFRVLMNRVMLRMNPSQRKICMMIYKITVVEIILILAVIVGFIYFNR
jgi:hypothetical protein